MNAFTFTELQVVAQKHNAIAISNPRTSNHSFTGYCCDVFFDDAFSLVAFIAEAEVEVRHFIATSFEEEYARARVPVAELPF